MIKIAPFPDGKDFWATVDFLKVVDSSDEETKRLVTLFIKEFGREVPIFGFDPDFVFGNYMVKHYNWHIIEHTPVPIPEDDGRLVLY